MTAARARNKRTAIPAIMRDVFEPARTKAGRFKTSSKYAAFMPERVVELMSEGASKAEVAAELGISRETLYDWTDPQGARFKPALARALAIGVYRAEAWWQRLGRLAAVGSIPGFNATSFVWITKNRFGWKERVAFSSEQPLAVTLVDFSNALVPEPAPGAPDEPPP